MDVADPPVLAGVAPGPAETIVEHFEPFSGLEFANDLGFERRRYPELGCATDLALDRLGVMRSDDLPGERKVGKVLAVSVVSGVGVVRRAGEREIVSAGGRRPGPGR